MQTNRQLFEFTGEPESFIVPSGVREIKIVALGAAGGAGNFNGIVGRPGTGGRASGILSVKPGEQLWVRVGGAGTTAAVGNIPNGGGFNGGGNALSFAPLFASGGGGGASDIQRANDRIIVAAGGGGAARELFGGNGGGAVGQGGQFFNGQTDGGPGTQTSGGAGVPLICSPGSLGSGGSAITEACGGGGGGYYGGGAGRGGGGGSSYVRGLRSGKTRSGIQQGNGSVLITWLQCERLLDVHVISTGPTSVHFSDPLFDYEPKSGHCFPVGTTRVKARERRPKEGQLRRCGWFNVIVCRKPVCA